MANREDPYKGIPKEMRAEVRKHVEMFSPQRVYESLREIREEKNKAADEKARPSPDTWDLYNDIQKRLSQIQGICGMLAESRHADDTERHAAWAAEDLIELTKGMIDRLYQASKELRLPVTAAE